MPTTIYIDNAGNLSGLADDTLDKLNTLGRRIVERVSNIEYDHKDGCWVATDTEGRTIASHTIRGKVIDLERAFLNKKIESAFTRAM